MDNNLCLQIIRSANEAREKTAEVPGFGGAIRGMQNEQLRSDALRDVGNVAMTALGVGAGARGLLGLIRALRPPTPTSTLSPAMLPLPVPVEKEKEKVAFKLPALVDSDMQATSKGGLSLYGPAMMLAGLGAAGLGWKGIDHVLDSRRRSQREDEMNTARQEFENALVSQYDKPVKLAGEVPAVAVDLDALFDKYAELVPEGYKAEELVKVAEGGVTQQIGDWVGHDNVGKALGGYGIYAGLSGLLAANYMFDKGRKRSNRSIVENALAERENRRYQQAPTEIYAMPSPIEELPKAASDNFYVQAVRTPLPFAF